MHSFTFLYLFWLLEGSFVSAQGPLDSMPFYWGFPNIPQFVTTIPECATVQLFIHDNRLKQLQPPFYLFAYEASGIPTVNAVGSDINNLSWTVDHASGSQLILSLTDARGVSGGIPNNTFTVTNGGTNSCLPQIPQSPFSVSTSVSKTLNTCDVLPLDIHGGVPPYNLTVVTLNADGAFNISIGKFSGYDWVNQAPPYIKLIATVSDATGAYAVSTPLLATVGTSDPKCNLKSGPRNSTDSADPTTVSEPMPTHSKSRDSKTSKVPIITGVIGAVGFSAILIAGFLFFQYKRDRVRQGRDPGGSSGGYGHGSGIGVPDDTVTPIVGGGVSSPLMGTAPNHEARNAGPLLMQNQHGGGYGDYSQSSYSSGGGSLSMGSPPIQPTDQYGRHVAAAGPSTTTSISTTGQQYPQQYPQGEQAYYPTLENAYGGYANDPRGTVSAQSAYSTPSTVARPVGSVGTGTRPESGVSWSASISQPVTSSSTGILAVANLSPDPVGELLENHGDVEAGPVSPSTQRQTWVIQHEDVEDVVEELPPAYRERTS